MARILLLNKPYGVLSQFTDSGNRLTLASILKGTEFKGFYPAGRLDLDSEGLILLTDDGAVQSRIAEPAYKLPKTYWVQVEGPITDEALHALRQGVQLKDGRTAPAKARATPPPATLWTRQPPVRHRENVPTSWLELTITEGRNRQVRRMTAAVGLPTLRLIRFSIGPWTLQQLAPGEFRWETLNLPKNQSNNRSIKPAARRPSRKVPVK